MLYNYLGGVLNELYLKREYKNSEMNRRGIYYKIFTTSISYYE